MHSASFEYARGTNLDVVSLRSVVNAFYAILAFTCGFILLKRVLWWRKYEKIYPSRKSRMINSMGSFLEFFRFARKPGIPPNVYILQAALGYTELFKKEKFFSVWVLYNPYIVITKAEAVENIISGSKNLQKHWFYSWLQPWIGTGLITSSGDKWKSRRKLLTPSFHLDILKDFLPVFNEQSQLLVKILEKQIKKPWIDVVEPVTLCILDIICETAMGVSIGAQKNSDSEYIQAVLRVVQGFINRVFFPIYHIGLCFYLSKTGRQFMEDVRILHNFTRQVITEKKKKLLSNDIETKTKKRKTFMDLLLEQHMQNQTFTEEDVREEVDTFLFGGHDTISMALSWSLFLIGHNAKVQEKILEEMDRIFGDDVERHVTMEDIKDMEYLDRVFKESQRLYPSVPFFSRTLSEDVTIDGYTLFKGNDATILTYSLHRDETVFPNPEVFDPDRFLPENCTGRHPFAYVPFSAGPRNCIGQRFAVLEAKVILANIFRNFTVESLDPRDKVFPLTEIILRPSGPIRIKFLLRRSPVTKKSKSTY